MPKTNRPKPKASRRQPGTMNSWETAYAALLDSRLQAGEIAEYAFEPEKLRVGISRCWYTPDFRVLLADGTVEFHEVKGFWRDDARAKLKAAALIHPYVFIAVTKSKKGAWLYERI